MIYTDVQFQLPLSRLEECYNDCIVENEIYGTWIPDLEEYCFDWLMWEHESDIVDSGSDHWCEPDAEWLAEFTDEEVEQLCEDGWDDIGYAAEPPKKLNVDGGAA